MTEEELYRFIGTGDAAGLATVLAGLSETERKKLSTTVSMLRKKMNELRAVWRPESRESSFQGVPEGIATHLGMVPSKSTPGEWVCNKKQFDYGPAKNAMEVAVLACCPLGQVKKTTFSGAEIRLKERVLLDRNPEWLAELIEHDLKNATLSLSFAFARKLIIDGLIAKPKFVEYYQHLAHGLRFCVDWDQSADVRQLQLYENLVAHPEYLENDVWQFFEIETPAFADDDFDKPTAWHGESWGSVLKRLAAEGRIDRQRLLDASLAGLSTGLTNNTLKGFARFFDYLEPTIDEIAARQGQYPDLLSNSAGPVVTFALKHLKALDKAKRLEGAALIAAADGPLLSRTKAHAKSMLTLLKSVARREKSLAAQVARTACTALGHEASDVQATALKLIDGLVANDDAAVAQEIDNQLEGLALANRPTAEAILQRLSSGVTLEASQPLVVESTANVSAKPDDELLRPIIEAARNIPDVYRKILDVDDATNAAEQGEVPPPLSYALSDIPHLSSVPPLPPIASLDELIDATSKAVEIVDDADEVERILDGVCRFCAERPSDFERRTGPLLKRVMEGYGSEKGLLVDTGVINLLHVWLRGEPSQLQYNDSFSRGPLRVWQGRLEELMVRVQSRVALPMLAMPTHQFGWIDPRALVERLQQVEGLEAGPIRIDLINALLRLAWQYRSDALTQAKHLNGEFGRALRWALGSDGPPNPEIDQDGPLWLAAGRARKPHGQLVGIDFKKLDADDPDGIRPAEMTWEFNTIRKRFGFKRVDGVFQIRTTPSNQPVTPVPDQPTVAMHAQKVFMVTGMPGSIWFHEMPTRIWPQHIDSSLAYTVPQMMLRIDDAGSSWEPYHATLRALFEPERVYGAFHYLILWVGLLGRDQDARGVALDAAIEALQDGRAAPQLLADTFARLTADGWVKLNRARSVLDEIARISPLHAHATLLIVEKWIAVMPTMTRDTGQLLEFAQERVFQLGVPLHSAAIDALQSIKGSGKAAKLAKKLLKITTRAPTADFHAALAGHLDARCRRAERWQQA